MDRFFSDDSGVFSIGGDDIHFTGRHIEFVETAMGTEIEQTFFGNINDLEADFIVVSGEHYPYRSGDIKCGNGVAHYITFYFTAVA